MSLRHSLNQLLPPSTRLAVSYWYRHLAGKLDRDISVLAKFIRPGSTAIDIGARTGLYSYMFAQRGARHVHAIDPLPGNRLAQWANAHPDRITVHRVALSDAAGKLSLHVPLVEGQQRTGNASLSPPSGPHDCIEVRVETLEALAREHLFEDVSIIKIDVEGHEDAVLLGAEPILKRDRPSLLVEIEERCRTAPPEAAFAWIESLGYEGMFFGPTGELIPVSRFSTELHQRKHVHTPSSPLYANNFLFVHGGVSVHHV